MKGWNLGKAKGVWSKVGQENTESSWGSRSERKGMKKGRLTVVCPWTLGKEAFPIIPLQAIIRSTILNIKSYLQAPEEVPRASRLHAA